MSDYSIVDWHGKHEGYRCGYCGSSDSNYSHGMTAYKLTVEDYQDLIDRGWRRSGTYIYKPTLKTTCCPQYPIRCNALGFRLSKSQKKLIKRVNKYLSYGIVPGREDEEEDCPQEVPFPLVKMSKTCSDDISVKEAAREVNDGKAGKSLQVIDSKEVHHPKPGVGEDPTKPKCQKAKLRRLAKKQLKSQKSSLDTVVPTKSSDEHRETRQKQLEDYLNDIIENPAHTLEIRLVHVSTESRQFQETAQESYLIFKKYQMAVHKETESECSHFMYENFLVETSLQKRDGLLPHGYGSFHQLYILDGKVIAVGVIDILPKCISSVYLYYDPDFSFLSLGTYSALREIAFTRKLNSICPDISFYYLGFYIYSCPKMRYKGQYSPSFLLCPETYNWFPIEMCVYALRINKYSRFEEQGVEDSDSDVNVDDVLVLHQRQVMPYAVYKQLKKRSDDRASVITYACLIGKSCATKILLYRS